MGFKSSIIVRLNLAGFHNWTDCPYEEVIFLKHKHRHTFFFELKIPVTHDNRDVEFFMMKEALGLAICELYPQNGHLRAIDFGSKSCEMIGKDIIEYFIATEIPVSKMSISVWEDNENGGLVEWEVD